jgi:hypothetical protein
MLFSSSGTRQRCLLSLLLFSIALEVPSSAIRQEKKRKGIKTGKEEVSRQHPQKSTELVKEFNIFAGYKVNV